MDIKEKRNAFWAISLMVVLFYLILWRPQKKQQKQQDALRNSIQPGDNIMTTGGVMGNIVSLHDDYLVVRIADRVEIKVTRAAVAQVLGKAEGKKAAKKAEKAEKAAEKAAETKAEAPAEAKSEAVGETKEAEAKDGQ